MLIVDSRNGVPVRLTEERWQHIADRHPELRDQRERILETVAEPDIIQQGDFGELLAGRYYSETPLTSKFLMVAYREISSNDGFIVTAYLARRLSTVRAVIWKKP
jgi:hypothetical protein